VKKVEALKNLRAMRMHNPGGMNTIEGVEEFARRSLTPALPPKGSFAQIILSRPRFALFVVLQTCSHCNQHWRQFSLSRRERAVVRGKVMDFYPTQKTTIPCSNCDLLCKAPDGGKGETPWA
jgi:hypothetical protein